MIVDMNLLIEYNVRMRPECQLLISKLKADLLDIFQACCEGTLTKLI